MRLHTPPNHSLLPGFYVPIVTLFNKDTEDLDFPAIRRHVTWLARSGVTGIVTQGSNGEAVHLSHTERQIVTSTVREALNASGFESVPIIVGCGAQSTRETIELCHEAQLAGGDAALVLPPSYYGSLYNKGSLLEFFTDVANQSPIPILIYNYPGATSGVDLDSDTIISLSRHPNIIGCKLTCGNTGKLNRIASATAAATPTDQKSGFLCMGGSADFTTQALIGGGSGIIGGLGNVAPKSCVRIVELYQEGKFEEAAMLQEIVARGDWAAIKSGIVGTKAAMQEYCGYGGYCRKPVPRPTKEEDRSYVLEFAEVSKMEKSL